MESQTQMVFASMYRLRTREGGRWDAKGDKVLVKTGIFQRDYAEMHNNSDNNLIFEIDEDKTAELADLREAELEAQRERKMKENISKSDLIDAIVGKTEKPKQTRKRKPKSDSNED